MEKLVYTEPRGRAMCTMKSCYWLPLFFDCRRDHGRWRCSSRQCSSVGVIQPMSGNWFGYAQEGEPAFEYIIKRSTRRAASRAWAGRRSNCSSPTTAVSLHAQRPRRGDRSLRRRCNLLPGTLLSAEALAVFPVIDEFKTPTLSIWSAEVKAQYMFSIGYPYDRSYSATMANFLESGDARRASPIRVWQWCIQTTRPANRPTSRLLQKVKAMGFNVVGEVPSDQVSGSDRRSPAHSLAQARRNGRFSDATRRYAVASGALQLELFQLYLYRRHWWLL